MGAWGGGQWSDRALYGAALSELRRANLIRRRPLDKGSY